MCPLLSLLISLLDPYRATIPHHCGQTLHVNSPPTPKQGCSQCLTYRTFFFKLFSFLIILNCLGLVSVMAEAFFVVPVSVLELKFGATYVLGNFTVVMVYRGMVNDVTSAVLTRYWAQLLHIAVAPDLSFGFGLGYHFSVVTGDDGIHVRRATVTEFDRRTVYDLMDGIVHRENVYQ